MADSPAHRGRGLTAVSDLLLVLAFVIAAIVGLGVSWVLVSPLERVGARLGL